MLTLHESLIFYPSLLSIKEGPACWTPEFTLLSLAQVPLLLEAFLELCVPCAVSTNYSVSQLLICMMVSLANLWTPFLHHLWLFHFWASSTEYSEWRTVGAQWTLVELSWQCLIWFSIHNVLRAHSSRGQFWWSGKSMGVGVRTLLFKPLPCSVWMYGFGHSLPEL